MSDNLRTKWSKGGPKLEVFRKINTLRNTVATANGRRPSVLLVIKITCCGYCYTQHMTMEKKTMHALMQYRPSSRITHKTLKDFSLYKM